MDISTEKLTRMEAHLNEVLAGIAMKKEEPTHVLGLIKPTAEQYSDAWITLSILDIIEPHVKALLNNVRSGDLKKVGLFIDFTIYQLERFGVKDSTQAVICNAQRAVMDIYSKFRQEYFTA